MLFLLFYEDMTLLIGAPYSIFQMVVKHLSVYSVGAAKWKLMAAVDLHPPCFFFKDSWGFLDISRDNFFQFFWLSGALVLWYKQPNVLFTLNGTTHTRYYPLCVVRFTVNKTLSQRCVAQL